MQLRCSDQENLQIFRILELQSSQLCQLSVETRSFHTKISLAEASKPLLHCLCRHLPLIYDSSTRRLLHLGSVPDVTKRCFFFLVSNCLLGLWCRLIGLLIRLHKCIVEPRVCFERSKLKGPVLQIERSCAFSVWVSGFIFCRRTVGKGTSQKRIMTVKNK